MRSTSNDCRKKVEVRTKNRSISFRRCVIVAAVGMMIGASYPSAAQSGTERTLAQGTHLTLQLNDYLSTKMNHEGDVFTASVIAPVTLGERVVVPKGSVVSGTVGRVLRPGRFRGKAVMTLVFESIRIPGTAEIPIVATLAEMHSDGGAEVKSEGSLQGEGSAGQDTRRVAAPAASGAGIGALAGGGRGAAVGAGVGAIVGLATVFATRGKDLEIRRGATLDIVLEQPLTLSADHEIVIRR